MSVDYDHLDPGIRDVVRLLNDAGFKTTDSGDGVSKPKPWYEPDERGITEALPFPHVVCLVANRRALILEAHRLQAVLGPAWHIEGTYYPSTETAVLMASKGLNG